MGITFFQRRPQGSNHSIERVFATVRDALPETDTRVKICRFASRGLFKRIWNMLEAVFQQGDVNHVTGDVHYLTLLLRKKRTVLTIHDCGTMLRLRGIRRFVFHWFWLKLPVSRCAVVSVISEQTKREVLRHCSCPESKIRVVPDPVEPSLRPYPRRFNLDKPVILQVGTGENKNLGRLALALSGIRCKLSIIGVPSRAAVEALEQSNVEYEYASRLSDQEVAAKYRESDLVAFCSTYEGFGMPIIEAQAVGRPVVTSNLEPMSEVAGGAACLVDPFDYASIRNGILRIIGEPFYRESLVRRGLENAKRFSSVEIGRQYMKIYQELAAVGVGGQGIRRVATTGTAKLDARTRVRRFIPAAVLGFRRRLVLAGIRRRYGQMTVQDTFSEVYGRGLWGNGSGLGSDERFSNAYCELVLRFAFEHGFKHVVDIGCGDFRVGRRIAEAGLEYVGVDVVPSLIEGHQKRFGSARVRFVCLDAIAERPPAGSLCLIRQVLQHLSNTEIVRVLNNCRHYPRTLVTEHVPVGPNVVPNKDKPHGPDTRMSDQSGVFLNEDPFSLPTETLLEVPCSPGEVLRTVVIRGGQG